MYTRERSKQKINLDVYRDKVLGCWAGKNIGGTLGGPFEGSRTMNDAKFYVQDLKGTPAPNDDLDLQLVWLTAVEEHGPFNVNERVLGEYWLTQIIGPWNEYGVAKANMRNGLFPPLSGACNNDRWKWSNGAWIRSEIWACLCPAAPDEAGIFAYYDACCDHAGEGIYAEIFTATLESMAFVVNDVRKLITYGLKRLPRESRVARAVNLACKCYDEKVDFREARERLVKDSEDLGWFQAPCNIGFVILGLLYGEGDFARSVTLANNCGDDTDCTAGTVGAIMGIMLGYSGIPAEWIEPIGESIQTCAILSFSQNRIMPIPGTIHELTSRVLAQALRAQNENGALPQLVDGETAIDEEYLEKVMDPVAMNERLASRSSYRLTQDFAFGKVSVEYENGPYVEADKPLRLKIAVFGGLGIENAVSVQLHLPEGWRAEPAAEVILNAKGGYLSEGVISVIAGDFPGVFHYLPVTIKLADRFAPYSWNIPFQKKAKLDFAPQGGDHEFWDCRCRILSSRRT